MSDTAACAIVACVWCAVMFGGCYACNADNNRNETQRQQTRGRIACLEKGNTAADCLRLFGGAP